MLISQAIPDLIGGVSQQPDIARYPNQLESMTNCLSDPVDGLRKRPATEHLARIAGAGWENAAVIPINRDPDNRFIAIANGADIKVFDTVDGSERTVTGDVSYLTSANPRRDILSLTVADFTFVLNRETVAAKLPDVAPSRPFEALIFVRAGNYARKYEVFINDNLAASYLTPTGSDPDQGPNIDTANIAETLVTGVAPVASQFDEAVGSLNSVSGLTVEQIGSLIYITSNSDFTIRVEDGQGGEAMRAIKDTVQSFTDLPRGGKEGFVVKIRGTQGSEDDDYYVVYEGNETWRETVKPEAEIKLDPATMPHALVRQNDGTFTFEALPWVDRGAGDDNTNPFPSLVGKKITSMVYFRNRLGFLADENVVLSQAGDFFNLFRTTATRLIDSDPIDLIAGDSSGESSPVSKLIYGTAFDRKLVLFARNAQFILEANRGVLSPATAELNPVTAFEASELCRPVTAGRYIYFPYDKEGSTGVREFYVDGAAQTEDATEVTNHVPSYIPPNVVRMTGSTLENIILCLTEDDPNAVYVYRYFWARNGEKLQSSWSRWEFDADAVVLGAEFFDNTAFLTIQRPDGIHINKMRFRRDLKDPSLPYFLLLDDRAEGSQLTLSYDAPFDRTIITLPYTNEGDLQVYTLFSGSGLHAPGLSLEVTKVSTNQLAVPGDKTSWDLCVGRRYEASFEPTRPYPRGRDGAANTEAVLKVKDYSFNYVDTGYFKIEFTPEKRATRTFEFSGRVLGSTELSSPPLDEGTYRAKTPCRNRYWSLRFSNNTPFQSAIRSASWRGLVESKARNV